MSCGTGRPVSGGPELALGAGVLAVGAVAIGAIDVPGLEATLRAWVWPEFAGSWLLRDDYGLGPLPGYRVELARYGVVVAVAAGGARDGAWRGGCGGGRWRCRSSRWGWRGCVGGRGR
jgi:hypothetical protein